MSGDIHGVIQQQFSQYLANAQSMATQFSLGEAVEALERNMPRCSREPQPSGPCTLRAFRTQSFAACLLIYLPNPATLSQQIIPTPIKFAKKSLSFVAGGKEHAGRVVGTGIQDSWPRGQHQIWRMDVHPFTGPHADKGDKHFAGPKEIAVWPDRPFHFHVIRPPN